MRRNVGDAALRALAIGDVDQRDHHRRPPLVLDRLAENLDLEYRAIGPDLTRQHAVALAVVIGMHGIANLVPVLPWADIEQRHLHELLARVAVVTNSGV